MPATVGTHLIGALQQLSIRHNEHFVRELGLRRGYLASHVFCLSETYKCGFLYCFFFLNLQRNELSKNMKNKNENVSNL